MDAGNRAIALWRNWEAKEKMLLEVFGHGKVSENLVREKYMFLSEGMRRIGAASEDEKLVLGLIKKSALRLGKQLYPHPVLRLFYRVKRMVFDRPVLDYKLARARKKNLSALDKVISSLGVDTARLNLAAALDSGKKQVDIPLSSALSAGRQFEMELHLERESSGELKFSGYSARLKNAFDPAMSRSFGFDAALGISSSEALNLLQGRAVLKDYGSEGFSGAGWLQLDFAASSGSGPVLRELAKADGFDLERQLEALAKALGRPELASGGVLNAMERGNQVMVQDASGDRLYLEASALSGKLLLRDEKQRPVSLEKVLKAKEKRLAALPEMKISKVRQKVQDKSLGIA